MKKTTKILSNVSGILCDINGTFTILYAIGIGAVLSVIAGVAYSFIKNDRNPRQPSRD